MRIFLKIISSRKINFILSVRFNSRHTLKTKKTLEMKNQHKNSVGSFIKETGKYVVIWTSVDVDGRLSKAL